LSVRVLGSEIAKFLWPSLSYFFRAPKTSASVYDVLSCAHEKKTRLKGRLF